MSGGKHFVAFRYKKMKKCRVCGEEKMMFRQQKTCDECKAPARKEKK